MYKNIGNSETGGRPPQKQLSPRQLAANRANSKKSTGPKTQAGKNKAKFNALIHGLTAGQICLPGESREDYEQRRQEYIDYFQPANLIEFEILDDLVAARSRKQRTVRYETALILESCARRHADLAKTYKEISPDVESAMAFKDLCDNSHSMKLLDRYETRVMNNIKADWKQLQEILKNRPPATEAPTPDSLPIEAIPETEQVTNPTEPQPATAPEPVESAHTVMIVVVKPRIQPPAPPAFDTETGFYPLLTAGAA